MPKPPELAALAAEIAGEWRSRRYRIAETLAAPERPPEVEPSRRVSEGLELLRRVLAGDAPPEALEPFVHK